MDNGPYIAQSTDVDIAHNTYDMLSRCVDIATYDMMSQCGAGGQPKLDLVGPQTRL